MIRVLVCDYMLFGVDFGGVGFVMFVCLRLVTLVLGLGCRLLVVLAAGAFA